MSPGASPLCTGTDGPVVGTDQRFGAEFAWAADAWLALMAAEVINLSRNVVLTGDDFRHIACDKSLSKSIPGSSDQGCRCSQARSKCTLGMHTVMMRSDEGTQAGMQSNGLINMRHVRIEKCGQRGIMGKYCAHLHLIDRYQTQFRL